MNKREIIHQFIDMLLDLEESSSKRVSFDFSGGNVNTFTFYVARNRLAYQDWLAPASRVYFDYELFEKSYRNAIESIETIKAIPDGPVEEMVTIQLPVSKAKELGIA